MATQVLPAASSHILPDQDAPAARSRQQSLLRRLFDFVTEAQMRRAEREIVRVLGPERLAALRAPLPPRR